MQPLCRRHAGAELRGGKRGGPIRKLGQRGLALWREHYPGTVANGTLVLALPRDRAELDRFERMTVGFVRLGAERAWRS